MVLTYGLIHQPREIDPYLKMLRLATTIEAILYLKSQPVSLTDLAEYAKCDKTDAQEALLELMDDYAHRDSALEVVETPTGYCLQLRTSFQELMQTLIPPEIGVGVLRTLAAIALKGSIAQTELVELRGSGAYQQVQELVQLGYVRKRRQSDGRSYWLQVTDKFHQYFELDQLPKQLELPLNAVGIGRATWDSDAEQSEETYDSPNKEAEKL